LVEIEARDKFYRRHIVDIPRKKFFVQRRYRANWPLLDGHELVTADRADNTGTQAFRVVCICHRRQAHDPQWVQEA
jgi:hypothetical protein